MPIAALAIAALLGTAGAADIDYDVTESSELIVNNADSSDIGTVVLSETTGIVCYNDWNGAADGWCNVLDLSNSPGRPSKGAAVQLKGVKLLHFTLARLSDTQAVACYARIGSSKKEGELLNGPGVCNVLEVKSGLTLRVGADMLIDDAVEYPHHISVASFTETSGVVCYGDKTSEPDEKQDDLKIRCALFAVDPAARKLTRGDEQRVDGYVHHVTQVSVTAFSGTTAVVCYAVEEGRVLGFPDGGSWCSPISVQDSQLSVGQYAEISRAATFHISVANLREDYGVLCFVDGGDSNSGKCQSLGLDNQTITFGEALEVNSGTTDHMSMAAMSPTAAMVCYAAGADLEVGRCNGLVLSHGTELAMGDDKEIDNGAFYAGYQCSIQPGYTVPFEQHCGGFVAVSAYLSPLNMNGLACYAGIGGDANARCSVLSVPPPTTTTTATTATETSSTTPHTTTESSTTTETTTATTITRTTKTKTETTTTTETSSTTPHTTTETSTTEAPIVTSGAASKSLAVIAAAVAAWLVL